tara:strand:+ start:236 stop:520 length:285 start_codon:yes stop_codon:yes gene_type:complete
MTRSELLKKLCSERPDISAKDVEAAVNTIFNTIIFTVADGRRVELRNFGTFSCNRHEAKIGRNPRTGEMVEFKEKMVTSFRLGKLLFERLNSKA